MALWFAHQFNSRRVANVLMKNFDVRGEFRFIHTNFRYQLLKNWPDVRRFMKGRFDIEIDELVAKAKKIIEVSMENGSVNVAGNSVQWMGLAERAVMNLMRVATDMDDRALTRQDLTKHRDEMLKAVKEGARASRDNVVTTTE